MLIQDDCQALGGTFLGLSNPSSLLTCEDADADPDGDGVYFECDGCPNDLLKTVPGQCGCGVPDDDSDGDACADCVDECPHDPSTCVEPCAAQACCLADGSCETVGLAECRLQGGVPGGLGNVCAGDANGNGIDDACEFDPHGTVSGQGDTSTNFGNSVIDPLPADFFEPGSEPFTGDIALEGIPINPWAYGEASTLIARSDEPIQPGDPHGTVGIADVELVALSLRSLAPIEVITFGLPAHWDVAVTLSDTPAGPGTLTATKTHCNGGTFDMTLPVNPQLTFTKVDGPGSTPGTTVTLDAAAEGEPPLVLTTEGAPWVHSVWDMDVYIYAPFNGTFVPGVEETPGCSGPSQAGRLSSQTGVLGQMALQAGYAPESAGHPAVSESATIRGTVAERGGLPGLDCPADSLFAQPAQQAGEWWAGASEVTPVNLRFESFSGITEPICDLHWWGLNLDMSGADCTENPMPFEVRFYEDAGGTPGAEVCSYAGALVGTAVADIGYDLYRYDAYFDTCCSVTDGWVSVQGGGDPLCWFWWYSSNIGDSSHCRDSGFGIVCDDTFDLSVCLTPGEPYQSAVPVSLSNPEALTWHTVEPVPPPDLSHRARKHRYLSIDPGTNAPDVVAIKVEVAEMRRCEVDPRRACLVNEDCDTVCADNLDKYCTSPDQCGGADCIATGPCVDMALNYDPPLAWLVQQPQQQVDGEWTAGLGSTVYSEDWSTYPMLHIGGCPIVPCVSYHLYACDPLDLSACSAPLEIATQRFPAGTPFKLYGDVSGGTVLPGPQVLPPDGYVNVKDLQVTLLTIVNYGGPTLPQAHPTWVDLHGLGTGIPPNYILNVSDLQAVYVYSLTDGKPYVNTQGGLDPQDCP
jgi:hypothetical protein